MNRQRIETVLDLIREGKYDEPLWIDSIGPEGTVWGKIERQHRRVLMVLQILAEALLELEEEMERGKHIVIR